MSGSVADIKVPANMPERDDITSYIEKSWDELFSMDAEEVADYQLKSVRRRFDMLLPQVSALRAQADVSGVTRIDSLDDVIPLLFTSEAYKSYPLSLLEKNRFDLLTKWMSNFTAVDLSHIDVSGCEGIDQWLGLLEQEAPMAIGHTSGTSGKLSFLPRTKMETNAYMSAFTKTFEPFGQESGARVGRPGDPQMPVVMPVVRHGRTIPQRIIQYCTDHIAPSPAESYALDGTLSADVVSLAGRIRIAQAKGELAQMKLTPALKEAMRLYLAESATRPREIADFLEGTTTQLSGKRVLMSAFTHTLYPAAVKALAEGRKGLFTEDSLIMMGGGGKDIVLPPNCMDIIKEYLGVERLAQCYGMTEMGVMPACPNNRFHIPPYYIPFLLDAQGENQLPRKGTQTGRLAYYDLTQQTLWGGGVSGDKVTIDWETACGCGRKGPYVHNSVARYPASVSGDDKILCAATIDNTDAALNQLLAL